VKIKRGLGCWVRGFALRRIEDALEPFGVLARSFCPRTSDRRNSELPFLGQKASVEAQ